MTAKPALAALRAAMQRGQSLDLDTVVNELLAKGEPDQSG
jgi:hypothetical protein